MVSKAIIVASILSIFLASTFFYAYATPTLTGQFHLGLGSTMVPYHNVTYHAAKDSYCCWFQGAYNSSHYFVITDEETWKKINSQAFYCTAMLDNGARVGTLCNLPTVDFSTQRGIAVFQGWKGSSGFGIKITRIDEGLSTIVVHVQETVPDRTGHCLYTLALIYPYQMVTIPKTQLPVIFQTETIVATC